MKIGVVEEIENHEYRVALIPHGVEVLVETSAGDGSGLDDAAYDDCVADMPGAVPRTSTFALTNATLPWAHRLADLGAAAAVRDSLPPADAANAIGGELTCEALARAFDMRWTPPRQAAEALG